MTETVEPDEILTLWRSYISIETIWGMISVVFIILTYFVMILVVFMNFYMILVIFNFLKSNKLAINGPRLISA